MIDDDAPLFCNRCGAELTSGTGNFYRITIEAVADPAPPNIQREDLIEDLGQGIKDLVQQLEGMSEQELMDQVYRRLVVFLCFRCYRPWIENPTGSA